MKLIRNFVLGGKGQSKGKPEGWEIFKKNFNLKTEEEAVAFKGNPIDLTDQIVKAGFPMLHVVGDADDVVPVAENTAPFEQKIKAACGSIQVIHKPGVNHHPHSLPNNKVFRQQLTEVLTMYKPMKEVWFDGSCVIDISDILKNYASDAVIFQGPQASIRWVGNERGIAPYPNWYTIKSADLKTGTSTALESNPDGDVYAPVEVDVPFLMTPKSYKWFWAPNTNI